MAAVTGTTAIDFGGTPTGYAYVDVAGLTDLPAAGGAHKIEAWLDGTDADNLFPGTIDHNSLEHSIVDMQIRVDSVVASDGFRIHATCYSAPGLTGTWLVSYVYTKP